MITCRFCFAEYHYFVLSYCLSLLHISVALHVRETFVLIVMLWAATDIARIGCLRYAGRIVWYMGPSRLL